MQFGVYRPSNIYGRIFAVSYMSFAIEWEQPLPARVHNMADRQNSAVIQPQPRQNQIRMRLYYDDDGLEEGLIAAVCPSVCLSVRLSVCLRLMQI